MEPGVTWTFNIDNGYQGFYAHFQTVYYIPNGLSVYFTNIKYLTIRYSKLKSVSSEDLKQFWNLKYLDLSYNELIILDKNLFQHNSGIETFWLNKNEIFFIDSMAFNKVKQIIKLNLLGNRCYNQEFNGNYLDNLNFNNTCRNDFTGLATNYNSMNISVELKLISDQVKGLEERTDNISNTSDDLKSAIKEFKSYTSDQRPLYPLLWVNVLLFLVVIALVCHIVWNYRNKSQRQQAVAPAHPKEPTEDTSIELKHEALNSIVSNEIYGEIENRPTVVAYNRNCSFRSGSMTVDDMYGELKPSERTGGSQNFYQTAGLNNMDLYAEVHRE